MAWLQLHVPARQEDCARIEHALEKMGATAVTLSDAADQPLLEPAPGTTPLWQEVVVSALFGADQDEQTLRGELRHHLGSLAEQARFDCLEDRQWERAWMDGFQPMRFGTRLWVIPGESTPPEPDAVNLHLDPGLAFGTGTHETTALCLEWLENEPLQERSVLDYGCGSGILAIAALLLGAREATGCDLDPQALTASEDNARRNGVSRQLHCCLPAEVPDKIHDVIIANILAGPLCDLAPTLAGHARPGTRLVLSGILAEQADSVARAYEPWFRLEPVAQRGDWVRITGTRLAPLR